MPTKVLSLTVSAAPWSTKMPAPALALLPVKVERVTVTFPSAMAIAPPVNASLPSNTQSRTSRFAKELMPPPSPADMPFRMVRPATTAVTSSKCKRRKEPPPFKMVAPAPAPRMVTSSSKK